MEKDEGVDCAFVLFYCRSTLQFSAFCGLVEKAKLALMCSRRREAGEV